MFERRKAAAETARDLVDAHGWKARQLVADKIAAAIKMGDLTDAKGWDAVGRALDLTLADGSDRTTVEGARSAGRSREG